MHLSVCQRSANGRGLPPVVALWLGLGILITGRAVAQENYEELPLHPRAQKWTNLSTFDERRAAIRMLSGEDSLDVQKFDEFFNGMVFPLFTQWRETKTADGKIVSPFSEGPGTNSPAAMKRKFKNDYLGPTAAKNALARDHLNEITLAMMERIASGNFHPFVRANAMLLLGDLGDTDINGPPLKKSLPALLKAATSADTIDAVRDPALRGLLRQATAGLDANSKQQVVSAMLAIVNQRAPPAGRSAEGHDWFRRRAIDVLAAIGEPGAGGAVGKALLQVIDDSSSSVPVRALAAAALPKLKNFSLADAAPTAAAKSLGRLAVDAYKSELAGRTVYQQPIAPDRLKHYLAQVRSALVGTDGKGGLQAMSTAAVHQQAAHQQYVAGLTAEIDKLAKACDTPVLAPTPGPTAGITTMPIPVDVQEPLARAIAAAGSALEAAVERGGNAPAADTTDLPADAPGVPAPVGGRPAVPAATPRG